VKLVHLVGFIIKKFVTMHGHMDLKFDYLFFKNDGVLHIVTDSNTDPMVKTVKYGF